MSFTKWLIHDCTIQISTPSQIATGEIAETFNTNRGTAIPCRFVARRNDYANEATGEQRLFDYLLLLKPDQTVTTTDRVTNVILRSTGGTVDAGIYKVLGVLPRNAKTTRHKSVTLEKIA